MHKHLTQYSDDNVLKMKVPMEKESISIQNLLNILWYMQGGIEVADGIKVANGLILRYKDCLGEPSVITKIF